MPDPKFTTEKYGCIDALQFVLCFFEVISQQASGWLLIDNRNKLRAMNCRTEFLILPIGFHILFRDDCMHMKQ